MNIVSPEIQNYAEKYTSVESEILTELRKKTFAERDDKSMLSGFYQGRLLAMLSKMIQPKRILEIGTYMGYSAMCLAEGLAENGEVITLDVNEEFNRTAKSFWAKSAHADKIKSFVGNALEIIPTLDGVFDLVFIDADKPNYLNYYNLVFPKLRIGGIVIADNILWSGKVLEAETGVEVEPNSKSLHEFNQQIQIDERVSNVSLAVRDGLMIVRKEKE
ncbi:MAG: O-methyltransferase [Acidobacteria bacterium]|nr:O-methyltransferase [Acidobacteriota bacterium]MCA1638864.1 O-methyltransferase [Acidobacteriota bacterium]